MDKIIAKKLARLWDLQSIDSKLDEIVRMRGDLPKEVEDLTCELETGQQSLQDKRAAYAQAEKEVVEQKKRIKDIERLLQKYEEQQINVRNNREYDAITKEIDSHKLDIQLLEKKIKNYYERIEQEKEAILQLEASLAAQKEALANKQTELKKVIQESEEAEEILNTKRKVTIQGVDTSLLHRYERIRAKVYNKQAVVIVTRGACSGCFITLPPQKKLDIQQKEQINTCEHCGRIIADVEEVA